MNLVFATWMTRFGCALGELLSRRSLGTITSLSLGRAGFHHSSKNLRNDTPDVQVSLRFGASLSFPRSSDTGRRCGSLSSAQHSKSRMHAISVQYYRSYLSRSIAINQLNTALLYWLKAVDEVAGCIIILTSYSANEMLTHLCLASDAAYEHFPIAPDFAGLLALFWSILGFP
jgi:hypothetical protein